VPGFSGRNEGAAVEARRGRWLGAVFAGPKRASQMFARHTTGATFAIHSL
jgi:hypothetical protein